MKAGRPTLIVFARNPVPGQVKTRLIPCLGEAGAYRLYLKLLARTIDTALQCSGVNVELWTDAAKPAQALDELIADQQALILRQQQGLDLGQRMYHAIDDALSRSDRVVLIGTDCPDWQASDLRQAFDLLRTNDAVLAPAMDGGYVLIGCRQNDVELFADIPWGSDQVFSMTKHRLQSLGWRWHVLPAHPDIDCEPDLKLVPELLE